MKNNCMKTRAFMIRKNYKDVLGSKVYYRLYRIHRIESCFYLINVTYCNESCSWHFGKNKLDAFKMFNKIVKNSVTPCTLKYIAQDFSSKSDTK